MQIKCSFCGALVDTSKHSECPNCGAQISNNEQFQKYQADEQSFYKEMQQLQLEEKQNKIEKQSLENEKLRQSMKENKSSNTIKALKIVATIIVAPLVFFLIFAIVILIIAVNIPDDSELNVESTESYVEPHHEVVFGDVVQTKKYKVVLDEWGYYEPNSYAIRDGEKYIKLHFVYTNTRDEKILSDEDIYCYDENGKECKHQASISDEDRNQRLGSQLVMPGKSYSGWCYFSVPESTTEISVTYGENIEIHVNLTEGKNEKS